MARARNYKAELAARNARARAAGFKSYYEQRIARAQRAYPGISRSAARGHAPAAESEALRLIRLIPKLESDTNFTFVGIDRQPDGTWLTARFDVIESRGERNIEELTFLVGPAGHRQLPNVANALRDSGWAALGAKYLTEWVQNQIPVRSGSKVESTRGSVFVDGLDKGRDYPYPPPRRRSR